VASIYRRMTWYRDNDFTLYPPGHLGELFGHCYPGDGRFQASKRMVHWLSLTDGSGVGVAVVPLDGPLVTHGGVSGDTLSLCADSEVGPPQYLTTPWVADHMIVAKPGTPLSGSFVLEAVGP